MENGSASSTVRIMKLSDYSVDAIFEKKLYLLIPFLLFNYEKRFEQIEGDDAQYHALMDEIRSVYERVDELIPAEDAEFSLIDVFTSKALRAMTHTVVNRLADKYPNIKEGVNAVVGGSIIEFEALKIKREGIREGMREGAADAFNTVAERLINNGSDGYTIATATGYDRNHIDLIAARLNRKVSWKATTA